MNRSARVPALDPDELDVINQMRERIETLALRLSLPHLTAGHESELNRIQDLIEDNADDVGQFLGVDRRFHLLT
jgi:DNA-binding GntR family transcriptional regulator